ncbi:MAG: methionyl-tRNA formyltransferase [Pseudonocardiaceae bacterium]|nr:methionyl-tRNA formyltransferase [Pseudonocardiaceae bacterium]
MRLVFAGTPEAAVPSLRALLASPRHEVLAAVTRPDAPAGRGRTLVRSPVGALADDAGLEVLTPRRPSEPEFLDRLRALAPVCCPVVAYGALVPRAALDIPVHGWVNLHFSLLPAWRGAAPVQAAIRHGDELTGASTFALEEGLDTGSVYGSLTEPVCSTDTAGQLLDRLATAGARLLVSTLDGIEDDVLSPVPQPADGVTHAPKVTEDDARVDFTVPAFAVDRQVRSVTPEPGAWTSFRDDRIKLGPVAVSGEDGLAPGQLRVGKREVLAGTATTAVRLGEVRPPGRKPVPAADWARGARIEPGERLA